MLLLYHGFFFFCFSHWIFCLAKVASVYWIVTNPFSKVRTSRDFSLLLFCLFFFIILIFEVAIHMIFILVHENVGISPVSNFKTYLAKIEEKNSSVRMFPKFLH